ncbi:DUF982 domain-containing protein [Shinella sp. BYT-45]|uniref:DUF982 domain-containing protein n=1 Tax=Shinella sp. BYT-45 TaxID=3377377 RepID=UPI003980D651
MDNGRWEEPITFETQRLGQYRTIASAAEAARALVEDWPVDTGEALAEARETCLAVLEGKKKPEAARMAFLRAAAEADVFIRPR